MKISSQLTDESLLRELGARLTAIRLERNLTQAALALESGVSKRTIERLESGEVATQLAGFVRVCRALGLVDGFNVLVPEPVLSPMAQLKLHGRKRQRASGTRVSETKPSAWTWGDDITSETNNPGDES